MDLHNHHHSQDIECFYHLEKSLRPFLDYTHTCAWPQTVTDWLSVIID